MLAVSALASIGFHTQQAHAAAPTFPTDITAAVGYNQVTLSWTAPTTATPEITGYEYSQNGDLWLPIPNSAGTTITYTVTSLARGVTHTFKIRTLNGMTTTLGESSSVTVIPSKLTDGVSRLSLHTNDYFGRSFVTSPDGNTLYISARRDKSDSRGGTGAVYVFTRRTNAWVYHDTETE